MRELDYVEGRNLIVKRAFTDGKADRLQGLVAHLTQAKVDAIVATLPRKRWRRGARPPRRPPGSNVT
jgi:hypothetical protein